MESNAVEGISVIWLNPNLISLRAANFGLWCRTLQRIVTGVELNHWTDVRGEEEDVEDVTELPIVEFRICAINGKTH